MSAMRIFGFAIAASALFSQVSAGVVKVKRADAPTDEQILNYALTLEHLENAFYSGALQQYDAAAFQTAGYQPWVRERFHQIAEHEASHVALLSGALADKATKPCEYKFGYTDVASFVATAGVLEGVGVSAYLGAAKFIQNKDYLTAAGAILTTEARHNAWVSSAIENRAAWSGPYDTPLDLDQVYSLAAPFITKCPDTNPTLPVKAFPSLSVSTASYKAGDTITVAYDDTTPNAFLAILSGLSTVYASIGQDKTVTLPADLTGTVYAVVTSSGTAVTDDNTIAGPAILSSPDSDKTA